MAASTIAVVVSRLRVLLSWFEVQRKFRFYSSSLLIVYEGQPQLQPLPLHSPARAPAVVSAPATVALRAVPWPVAVAAAALAKAEREPDGEREHEIEATARASPAKRLRPCSLNQRKAITCVCRLSTPWPAVCARPCT